MDASTVEVRVSAAKVGEISGAKFDGGEPAVNANVHAPMLRVADVFDVASRDLSLPGR